MKNWVYLLLAAFLSSCVSTSYFSIDTYNPSAITYPSDVKKLLIVNNSTPQSPTSNYEYKLLGVAQDTAKAVADSTGLDLCTTLGEAIAQSPYFDDVRLYPGIYDSTKAFLSDEALSQEEVEELCASEGVDAVVSLDRLLFKTTKNIRAENAGFFAVNVNVYVTGVLRTYLPGRKAPLAAVLISDSLNWSDAAFSKEILFEMMPPMDEFLRAAARMEGEKAYNNFVPYWESEYRWYYGASDSPWKKALAYAKSDKRKEAATIWEELYDKSSNETRKAKAASNIALCWELENDLQKAAEWGKRAYDFMLEDLGGEDQLTKNQQVFLLRLNERILQDQKLNVQLQD